MITNLVLQPVALTPNTVLFTWTSDDGTQTFDCTMGSLRSMRETDTTVEVEFTYNGVDITDTYIKP